MSVGEVAEPVPGPGQVLVAPLACGICGSDLHLVESQAAMPDLLPAIVLGHEFVGELLDYGPDTERRIPLGMPVTSVPYLDTGDGPQLVGLSPAVTGGLAERLVLQERRLLPVSGDVPLRYAAFTEPLAVGVHAVAAADLQPGDAVLVVGCGPVGLSVIACLKAAGVGPVVAADFSPSRRALAEQIGADVVVDPAVSSPYQSWAELAGAPVPMSPLMDSPRRANTVVFECVGVPGILATVMDSVPPHTRIVVVGVCMQPDTITPMVGTTKELSIRFVFAYRPDEFARALDWIAGGTVDVAPLVTATLPLDAATEAFEELRQPDKHCKILLLPT
ncbi:zinc-binding dehydrogenase [Mycolicibacterium porcinum]|uniref:Zinc-binding dehydrogenase n=1 Tax=Mycolicibacterium porcinum TaxID=39693 RepID=A0ABV3VI08_9MYCO